MKIVIILFTAVFLLSNMVCQASGLEPINQAALQAKINKMAKSLGVPGAFVLLQTPQGEYLLPYGTSQLGSAKKQTANMHFRIGSNTKMMTSAVILLLAQDDKLKLTDSIAKYIPNVPNGDQITLADLLHMRSGLYNYTDSPLITNSLDTNPKRIWLPEELLKIAFKEPPLAKPNTEFHYSNTNYLLLGLVAEKVGKKPLEKLFEERLFKPLGMKNTFLPKPDQNTMPSPYSHGYLYGTSAVVLTDQSLTPQFKSDVRAGKIKLTDCTNQNPSYAYAAGAVVSTTNDLIIWMKALVNAKLFNSDYQRIWLESFRPENPEHPKGQKYGFGMRSINLGPTVIYYHGGEMPGFNSFFIYDPKNKMTLAVWTNLVNSLDGVGTAKSIMIELLKDLYKEFPK